MAWNDNLTGPHLQIARLSGKPIAGHRRPRHWQDVCPHAPGYSLPRVWCASPPNPDGDLHAYRRAGSRPPRLALLEEARRWPPDVPPLPESFMHFRRELGEQVFGAMGITREDKAGHDAAVLRNWEFFRAPLAGIVCMNRDLSPADALSVGMFLQTLLLALTARGLDTIVEVSIAGYPQIVRAQLAIPAELSILCGLAVGYADPDFPANEVHIGREPIEKNVVFLES